MWPELCPRCGKNATVIGSIPTESGHAAFQPLGIRWLEHFRRRFFKTTVVRFVGLPRACLGCHLVWGDLPPGELREIIQREGIAIGGKKEEPEI